MKPHTWLANFEPDAQILPEHENALVGMCIQFGRPPVALYDYTKVITNLMSQGMSNEEAADFFDFNIFGAWLGDYTPAFIVPYTAENDGSPV